MYGISSPARPTAPTPRRSASCRRRTCRGQGEPRDDLAVAVVLAGRHEPEPLAEPGEPVVLRCIAGQQFGGALGPHQLSDLPHHRRGITAALVPLVAEQLPQQPWPDDL